MTNRQIKFCEYYLQTGNATEAAKKAGYSLKTADKIGFENLKKPEILQYIEQRTENQKNELIADTNEVLKFYSAVMRGEIKDQFGLDAALSDRIKAGDSLMKRYAVANEKNKNAMAKLDELLREFQDAFKPETN